MANTNNIHRLSDYHIHTVLCKHAVGDVGDYKEAARNMGIPEICFSDHMPSSDGYDPAHRMAISEFPVYRDMVASIREEEEPRVLFGIEADYYEGCENFLEKWLESEDFDFVIGSVHFIHDWGFDNPSERHVWDSVNVRSTWHAYFDLIGRLADSGLFDAVGHIDLPKKFGNRPSESETMEIVQPVLDRIAAAGMGIEINTAGLRKEVGEIYPSPLILSLAWERGIPICFGSDAHRPEEVGYRFPDALELAKEAGYKNYFRMESRRRFFLPLP